MDLGLFFMPLHRPDKPFGQSLEEDRQTILLADELGFSEVWMGEHLSSKAEPIPAPLIFLATLIQQTKNIRFGTGVINLGHRHPVVVAAEAALFDQLSGGRLMLGVGPGGLASDGELLGRPDMAERVKLVRDGYRGNDNQCSSQLERRSLAGNAPRPDLDRLRRRPTTQTAPATPPAIRNGVVLAKRGHRETRSRTFLHPHFSQLCAAFYGQGTVGHLFRGPQRSRSSR